MASVPDNTLTKRLLSSIEEHRAMQQRLFPNNDENLVDSELLSAAVSYTNLAQKQILTRGLIDRQGLVNIGVPPGGTDQGYSTSAYKSPPPEWPFEPLMWLPKGPRYNLIRAAALIVAELERLERLDRKLFGVEDKPRVRRKGFGATQPSYAYDSLFDITPSARAQPVSELQGTINVATTSS